MEKNIFFPECFSPSEWSKIKAINISFPVNKFALLLSIVDSLCFNVSIFTLGQAFGIYISSQCKVCQSESIKSKPLTSKADEQTWLSARTNLCQNKQRALLLLKSFLPAVISYDDKLQYNWHTPQVCRLLVNSLVKYLHTYIMLKYVRGLSATQRNY